MWESALFSQFQQIITAFCLCFINLCEALHLYTFFGLLIVNIVDVLVYTGLQTEMSIVQFNTIPATYCELLAHAVYKSNAYTVLFAL